MSHRRRGSGSRRSRLSIAKASVMPAMNRNSRAAIPPTNWESTYGPPSRRSMRANELKAWHWIMMTTASPRIQSRKGNLFTRTCQTTPVAKFLCFNDSQDLLGHAAHAGRYTTPVRLNPASFGWLLRQSIVATIDDGCFGIAKGAAYSALLSFFPVLTSAATILVQTRAEVVAGIIQNFLSEVVPPDTRGLVVERFRIAGER